MSAIKLRGWKAVAAVAILIAVGGARFLLPTTAVDEMATEPIHQWLTLKATGELGLDLDQIDVATMTAEQSERLVADAAAISAIEIVDLAGRRAGRDRMIVRTRFRAGPDAPEQTLYLEMRTRTIGRWEVKRETSSWRWRTAVLGGG